MATNGLSEQIGQTNTPNEEIKSLVGSVDISSFNERLDPILSNPILKENLLQVLKENQPITGGLQLTRLLKRIEETQVATKNVQVTTKDVQVTTKDVQVTTKETQSQLENDKRFESAKIAQKEVLQASTNIYNTLPDNIKGEISGKIQGELQNINSGKIPSGTKSFLDSIGANTPEKIGSLEVQGILTARISTQVYLERKDEIIKNNPDPELAKQFGILETNAPTLGVPRSTPASGVTNLLGDIPKSEKDTVVSTVNSLTKSAPDTLITRNGDRLNWEDQRGSQYEIDMAVRPPKLTKSQNGLSISRTEQEENPEVAEIQKDITTSKEKIKKSGTTIQENLTTSGVYGLNLESYSPTEIRELFSGIDIDGFEEKLNNATTPESQASLKEELKMAKNGSGGKLSKSAIEYIERILSDKVELGKLGSSDESVESKDWKEKLKGLKELKSSDKLENYAKEKEELEKKEKKLGEIKSPSVEDFDIKAEDTIRRLDSLGFDKIGQENLNTLMRGLQARDSSIGIWESGEINMDDSIVREAQFKDLEQVAQGLKRERAKNPNTKDENSLENVFNDVSKMLKGNEAFRNLWNSPIGLSVWLKKQGAQETAPKTEEPTNNQ